MKDKQFVCDHVVFTLILSALLVMVSDNSEYNVRHCNKHNSYITKQMSVSYISLEVVTCCGYVCFWISIIRFEKRFTALFHDALRTNEILGFIGLKPLNWFALQICEKWTKFIMEVKFY